MTRAIVALSSGLAAAVLAGAFLYHRDSLPLSTEAQAGSPESAPPQQAPSAATEPAELDSDTKEPSVAPDRHPPNSPNDSRAIARNRQERDEATVRADIRKNATEDVRDSYALLLEDLTLTPEEKKDLVALLIDMQTEGVWARGSTWEIRGREIPDQERYERIAAAIGQQKLIEFIALEENRQAYWETTQIARLMRRKDVPLTERQLDGVFDIVVEVHARYPYRPPPTELDRNSNEYIDFVLTETDELDRHVVELAPSVLSPTQVVHLFNAYDFMSRDRRSDVERQKKQKAAGDPVYIKIGWMTPGRWPAEVMRD